MMRMGLAGKPWAKPLPTGQMTRATAIKMPLIMSLLPRFDDSSESRAKITLPIHCGLAFTMRLQATRQKTIGQMVYSYYFDSFRAYFWMGHGTASSSLFFGRRGPS